MEIHVSDKLHISNTGPKFIYSSFNFHGFLSFNN